MKPKLQEEPIVPLLLDFYSDLKQRLKKYLAMEYLPSSHSNISCKYLHSQHYTATMKWKTVPFITSLGAAWCPPSCYLPSEGLLCSLEDIISFLRHFYIHIILGTKNIITLLGKLTLLLSEA